VEAAAAAAERMVEQAEGEAVMTNVDEEMEEEAAVTDEDEETVEAAAVMDKEEEEEEEEHEEEEEEEGGAGLSQKQILHKFVLYLNLKSYIFQYLQARASQAHELSPNIENTVR
jgi:hypothetical protein